MKIVGFAGKGRVGKTTVVLDIVEYVLRNHHNEYTPVLLPFALPLKTAVSLEAGYRNWQHYKNEQPEAYRRACQFEGDLARQTNPDHWVNMWYEDVMSFRDKEDHREALILVDDVRYHNELDIIKKLGGSVYFIAHGRRILEDEDAIWRDHPSEEMANFIEDGLTIDAQLMLYTEFDDIIFNDYWSQEDYLEAVRKRYSQFLK